MVQPFAFITPQFKNNVRYFFNLVNLIWPVEATFQCGANTSLTVHLASPRDCWLSTDHSCLLYFIVCEVLRQGGDLFLNLFMSVTYHLIRWKLWWKIGNKRWEKIALLSSTNTNPIKNFFVNLLYAHFYAFSLVATKFQPIRVF